MVIFQMALLRARPDLRALKNNLGSEIEIAV